MVKVFNVLCFGHLRKKGFNQLLVFILLYPVDRQLDTAGPVKGVRHEGARSEHALLVAGAVLAEAHLDAV